MSFVPTSQSRYFSWIVTLTLLALLSWRGVGYAACTESGSYLACEDWDSDTPPTNWPYRGGPTWHGWTPANYLCSDPNKSLVTSERAHSGSRSLRQTSQYINGERPATDISYSIPASSVVHIRFYVYLTSTADITAGHFIFINTASAAEIALDWRDCTDQTYRTCGGMYLVPHSYGPEVWNANNLGTSPFNWRAHLNQWVLVEWRVDLRNDLTSLWIDETPQLVNWNVDWSDASASDIIISGWRSLGSTNDQSYWIDDFVVSTSYIGPRGASGVDTLPPTTSGHSPVKNATGVPANTNISLHVLDSGDGVNRSSIVMTVNGQTVTPTITGSPADYTVFYNPSVDFSPGQTVTVTVDASDLHTPPNVMTRDFYRFTVAADTTPPAAPTGVTINVQ